MKLIIYIIKAISALNLLGIYWVIVGLWVILTEVEGMMIALCIPKNRKEEVAAQGF